MKRTQLITLLLLLIQTFDSNGQVDSNPGKSPEDETKTNIFAGIWRLLSRIDKTKDGKIVPEASLGSDPVAILFYDPKGNMSVQIMKRTRNDNTTIISTKQDSNNSVAFNGYDAYFGTYIIDTLNHQIKHQVQGAIDPKDVGKELIRKYSISGDTLLLWFNTLNTNVKVTRTLTWVRELK
jgi:hypothetical protein